jgi:L-fuconolactonase
MLPNNDGGIAMPIIDVQVHAYERNHPGRPWVGHIAGPDHVTGDEMMVAMDAVGVDGAILVSPFSLYRYDASYAVDVYNSHPARFRLIKPVDTKNAGVADVIAAWKASKGTIGYGFSSTKRPLLILQTPASTGPSLQPPRILCR